MRYRIFEAGTPEALEKLVMEFMALRRKESETWEPVGAPFQAPWASGQGYVLCAGPAETINVNFCQALWRRA